MNSFANDLDNSMAATNFYWVLNLILDINKYYLLLLSQYHLLIGRNKFHQVPLMGYQSFSTL
jgi:hypothetical protein